MNKIFVDGWQGTTGLKIVERLEPRKDVELIKLEGDERKDMNARLDAAKLADVTVLCLPDDAAREIAALADESVRLIDASTAHRTSPGWAYGMPELGLSFRSAIASSNRVANPGCHASGVIAIIYPLIKSGIMAPETKVSATSITGYSGGGKKMIADYEENGYAYPRAYAPQQNHKHLREIQYVTGLETPPVFVPVVAPFYSGMQVTVPLHAAQLKGNPSPETLRALYADFYRDGLISAGEAFENGFASAGAKAGKDTMLVSVDGNYDRMSVTAVFDNLGKGASGACIQNINIMLGQDERTGLII